MVLVLPSFFLFTCTVFFFYM